jgi:hypothetical protein
MAIERCDKCGKAFMSHSEVERHKRYEHPVPISPFEDKGSALISPRITVIRKREICKRWQGM